MKIKILNEKIKLQNLFDFKKYGGYTMFAYKFSNDIDLTKNSKKNDVLEQLKKIDSKYSFKKSTEAEKYEEKSAEKFVEKIENDKSTKLFDKNFVYEEVLKEVEDKQNEEKQKVKKEFDSQIFKLENERSLLEQQKNMALASFDISYASKISKEIDCLNDEISNKQKEYFSLTNKIDEEIEEQNLESQEDMRQQRKEPFEIISHYDKDKIENMKYNEKFEVIKQYLAGMTKQQALAELEDDRYKFELGNFYETLFAETHSREK